MTWLRYLYTRVRAILRAEAIHTEIDEELRFHIDMRAEENVRRGMAPDEARRDAERRFGNLTGLKERSYDVRGGRWLDDLVRDLRLGARTLARNRGFAAVAVVTLALGIGANTAIFSVVNAVLLRPLPYPDAERIVTLWDSSRGGRELGLTDAEYFDIKARSTACDAVAAYATGSVNLSGIGEPEVVSVTWASADLFRVVGLDPLAGRAFTAEEDAPDRDVSAVISSGLWRRRFGADPGVIGKAIRLNGRSRTIVGVMPSELQFPSGEVDVWVPIALDPNDLSPGNRSYSVVARLRPGVSIEQASADLNAIAADLRREYPQRFTINNVLAGVNVVPLRDLLVGDTRTALLIIFGAVCLVLLVACTNVANLLLARAEAQRKEVAVRAALGATRLRLVRQYLAESLLLAALGGALGLLVSFWATGALVAAAPAGVGGIDQVEVDWRLLGFAAAVSLGTGVLFGLAPAIHAAGVDLLEALRDGAWATSLRGQRVRSALVSLQIALAIVLLVGAGLLVRSYRGLHEVDPGFDPANVLTMRVMLPAAQYEEPERIREFYGQLTERLEADPGVVAAGTTTRLPLGGMNSDASFVPEGYPPDAPGAPSPNADYKFVSTGYFDAMRMRVLGGRGFDATDGPRSLPVVVINEVLAERYYPGADPVGRRLWLGTPESPWMTIVGVVGATRHRGLDRPARAEMYLPHVQIEYGKAVGVWRSVSLVVRTTAEPSDAVKVVRRELAALDPDIPVSQVRTMDEVLGESVAGARFSTTLVGAFSLVALLLALVGIYGVVSYSVLRRTREFGIRAALGARDRDIVGLVLRQALVLALVGVLAGAACSYFAARVLESQLFGVRPTDPLTYLTVALIVVATALLAGYLPARRAAHVAPLAGIRSE